MVSFEGALKSEQTLQKNTRSENKLFVKYKALMI